MLNWLTRYVRQLEYRDRGIKLCWCRGCGNEFGYIYVYPLTEELCKNCRKDSRNEQLNSNPSQSS